MNGPGSEIVRNSRAKSSILRTDVRRSHHRRIGSPGAGRAFFALLGLTQPERDVRWLHRLLHHGHQLFTQLIQVKLMAQRGTESLEGFGCVILAAIEAAINHFLDTM